MNKTIDVKKKNVGIPITEKIKRNKKSNKIKVFHPADQAPAIYTLILGYICRMCVIWVALSGMMFFICDAAGVSSRILDGKSLLLSCAIITVIFSVACINKFVFPVVMLGSAGWALYYILNLPKNYNPVEFAYDSAVAFFNTLLDRLVSIGYTSLGMYAVIPDTRIEVLGRNPNNPLLNHAVLTIAIVIGMVFAFSIIRKINMTAILLCGGAVIFAAFTYNISSSNTGFAMILAAFCGIIVMKMYEKRYIKAGLRGDLYNSEELNAEKTHTKRLKKAEAKARKKSGAGLVNTEVKPKTKISKVKTPEELKAEKLLKKEKKQAKFKCTATGGFAGFVVVLVSLLAIWVPAQTSDERFRTINFINDYMQTARLYVTAYLMGDDIDLNSVSIYNGGNSDINPRTMDFDSPQYSGARLLEITTSYNTPVYLRSWIGTKYDYESGTWYSANDSEVIAFRKKFGDKFSPEDITYNFYKYVTPAVTNITKYDGYKNNLIYGFITMQVNVSRVSGSGYLMYIPSVMNTEIGLLEYNSSDQLSYKYSSYFDGVYTSRMFAANKSYSSVSFVTSMRHDAFPANLSNNLFVYNLMCDNIDALDSILALYPDCYDTSAELEEGETEYPFYPEIKTIVSQYEAILDSLFITVRGESLMRRYVKMSVEERADFRRAIELEYKYRDYVYETYALASGNEYLSEKAREFIPESRRITTHDLVMNVITYLAENTTYTLTPKSPVNEEAAPIEAFIEDTKEGYCIHFATTAIMILRELGIPARYAEGYIASSFTRDNLADPSLRYRANVYDYNAHAWLEVYYPGLGWIQYEATPPYMSDMYEPLTSSITSYRPTTQEIIQPEEPPDIPDLNEDGMTSGSEMRAIIIKSAIIISSAAIIILTLYIIAKRMIKKADKANFERIRIIESAKSENEYDIEGSSRNLAKRINDFILAIYAALGIPPETGELPTEYASRLSKDFSSLSHLDINYIMTVIEKEEFGYGLTYRELYNLADYLNDISHSVYSGLTPIQKLKMRYIKRVI